MTSPLLTQITNDLTVALKAKELGKSLIFGYLGIPGIGKSEMVKQAAEQLDLEYYGEMVLSCCTPMDIIGKLPDHSTGTLKSYPNDDIPIKAKVGKRRVLWFIDEVTNAQPDTLAAMQQGLLTHRFGQHELGPNVIIMLAGNRKSDKAGASTLSTALYNRVTWRDCPFTPAHSDAAIAYLTEKYPSPAVRTLAGYFYKAPLSAADFEAAVEKLGSECFTQWCSPRSLEALFARVSVSDSPLSVTDMAGDIGLSRAAELFAFTQVTLSLPEYDDVVNNPDGALMPTEPAELYALASYAAARTDVNTFAATWRYMSRCDQMSIRIVYAQLALKFFPNLAMSKTFQTLICDNPQITQALRT